jgi:hypothetical protein
MTIHRYLVAALSCLVGAASSAHETPENRLTLVLRDETHLSLSYFVHYTEALHQALEPKRTLQDFILAYSAMKPSDFEAALTRAHAQLIVGTQLVLPTGEMLSTRNWQLPVPARARAMLQERTMRMLTGGDDHAHPAAFEIRAEAASTRPIGSVSVRLPSELGKTLVVSYQPKQAWTAPGAKPIAIRF